MADARPYRAHNTCAFVSHDQRSFPIERCVIGMADPGGLNLNQHLIVNGLPNVDALKRELSFAIRDGCLGLHLHTVDVLTWSHNF